MIGEEKKKKKKDKSIMLQEADGLKGKKNPENMGTKIRNIKINRMHWSIK